MEQLRLSRRLALAMIAGTFAPRSLTGAPPTTDQLPDGSLTGEIRVCLSDEPFDRTARITTTTAATVTAAGERNVQHRTTAGAELSISRRDGIWSIGDKTLKAASLEIQPAVSPGVWVNNRFYRGVFRLVPFNQREFWIVNILPLEHYLCAVVDGEIPGAFHNEARKAQAVAARTYAISRRQQNAAKEFDVYASPTRDQNYHGYQYRDARGRVFAGESVKSRQAVRETAGKVLLRNGRIERPYYSACCGGVTSAGSTLFASAADLPSVDCRHCSHCPRYRWSATMTTAELSSAIRKAAARGAPKDFEAVAAEVSGAENRLRLPQLTARNKPGKSVTVDTRAFRSASARSDLLSAWFSIEKDGDHWRLDGIGHGHGVGLCQWGADGFAKAGKTFDQILRHYYPDVEISACRG